MRSKTYLFLGLVLVLAMGMGCSNGGSSGGGSSQAIVGTWNLVSSTDARWAPQITFNANGTGQNSAGTLKGTFTWTQTGNEVTTNYVGGSVSTFTFVLSPDSNTSTASSGGSTAVYKRA